MFYVVFGLVFFFSFGFCWQRYLLGGFLLLLCWNEVLGEEFPDHDAEQGVGGHAEKHSPHAPNLPGIQDHDVDFQWVRIDTFAVDVGLQDEVVNAFHRKERRHNLDDDGRHRSVTGGERGIDTDGDGTAACNERTDVRYDIEQTANHPDEQGVGNSQYKADETVKHTDKHHFQKDPREVATQLLFGLDEDIVKVTTKRGRDVFLDHSPKDGIVLQRKEGHEQDGKDADENGGDRTDDIPEDGRDMQGSDKFTHTIVEQLCQMEVTAHKMLVTEPPLRLSAYFIKIVEKCREINALELSYFVGNQWY